MNETTGWSITGERGSRQQAIILPLGLGLAIFLFSSMPFLFAKDHALHDIFLGEPIIIASIATTLGMLFCFTIRGVRSRLVGGRSPKMFFFLMFGGYYLIGFFLFVGYSLDNHHLAVDLDAHGMMAQARLVRTFIEACGKNGCSTGIEYEFTPRGGNHLTRGTANEGNPNRYPNPEYNYAVSTGTVPILYDPENPSQSMVYWNGNIHRQASWGSVMFSVTLLSGFLFIPMIAMGIPLWLIMGALTKYYVTAQATGSTQS